MNETIEAAVKRFMALSVADMALLDFIRYHGPVEPPVEMSELLKFSGLLQYTGIPAQYSLHNYGKQVLEAAGKSDDVLTRYYAIAPNLRGTLLDVYDVFKSITWTRLPEELKATGFVEENRNVPDRVGLTEDGVRLGKLLLVGKRLYF